MRLSTRLLVLLFLMGIGMIVASVASVLVSNWGMLTMLTVQDIVAFIVPAVVAMAIFYRRPLHAMYLDRAPSWKALLVVVLFYIVSLPAMNWLVSLNEAMSLPSWMSGVEQMMRSLEDSAAETTKRCSFGARCSVPCRTAAWARTRWCGWSPLSSAPSTCNSTDSFPACCWVLGSVICSCGRAACGFPLLRIL